MREVLALYESHAGWFELDFAADLPYFVGDPAQLRQVLHNLLQNAQDALADNPAPRIVLRSERIEGGIRVTMTDNGAGFPEALMQRAFEPYVTTKPKGTGLGLVIVKKIVEEHGGSVAIANVTPHGARVVLTFATQVAQQALPRAAVNA
jgi:nitrogen fixation/metabolism regulation signal transduction histidine kinase